MSCITSPLSSASLSIWVCCGVVRATMRSSSPTAPATPGAKATSSQPSAFTTSSCTPAPRRGHSRSGQLFISVLDLNKHGFCFCKKEGEWWSLNVVAEPSDCIRLGGDAEVGHRWRGNGLLPLNMPEEKRNHAGSRYLHLMWVSHNHYYKCHIVLKVF